MSIDLRPLLETAFFAEDVQNASEAIERAVETFEDKTKIGARAFEVVAPPDPDEEWLAERLVRPLVYFCESEGSPVPKCAGVIVALFVGSRLHGITAEQVFRWGSEALHETAEELREKYGTREVETALR